MGEEKAFEGGIIFPGKGHTGRTCTQYGPAQSNMVDNRQAGGSP